MTDQQMNQTQFSFEEPIFEDTVIIPEEKPVEVVPKKPTNKKKLIIIGSIGFIFLVLVILILVIKLRNKDPEVLNIEPPVVDVTEVDPLTERIYSARALLDIADPTKQDLSFPPVNMTIRLDKKEK